MVTPIYPHARAGQPLHARYCLCHAGHLVAKTTITVGELLSVSNVQDHYHSKKIAILCVRDLLCLSNNIKRLVPGFLINSNLFKSEMNLQFED